MTIRRRLTIRSFCLIIQVATMMSLLMYLFLFASLKTLPPVFSHSHSSASSGDWKWAWQCVDGNCQRRPAAPDSSFQESDLYSSLDHCRLVCADFSTLWPKPTGKTVLSREVVAVNSEGWKWDVSGVNGGVEAKAFTRRAADRIGQAVGTECSQPSKGHAAVSVRLVTLSQDMVLDWTTDESYSLNINTSDSRGVEVVIKASTVFGARHALESLGQLVACRRSGDVEALVMMSGAVIVDKPVYSHRGLLLDTSRNFLPVSTILKMLDGLAASKMNVFHWHATDSHSFPLYSPRVPALTKYGAYSSQEVYMPSDVKVINDYAFQRGIRVVLEIDAPAHAGNGWQFGEETGLGKLAVCVNKQPWRDFCIQPPCGQLNPTNPRLFDVLRNLFRDIQDAFPTDMFHMGGDEVFFACWSSEKEIIDWLEKRGLNATEDGLLELWSSYHQQALSAWDDVAGHKKTPVILWSSDLTNPASIEKYLNPERYVIEMWTEKDDEAPMLLLAKGYSLIMATKDTWYLDHGFSKKTEYHRWEDVYENRLPESRLGVLGGEACMWGELVNEENIDSRVWPRTACVAERLWSDPASTPEQALPRLLRHSGRLLHRTGLRQSPITPEWCVQNDGLC